MHKVRSPLLNLWVGGTEALVRELLVQLPKKTTFKLQQEILL